MIEAGRLSYTSYTDLMGLPFGEFLDFRTGLAVVLEREAEARKDGA